MSKGHLTLAHLGEGKVSALMPRLIRTKHLEVVLKLTERCNINCTYCYVFNLGNEDYKEQSALISPATVEAAAEFLAQGVQECEIAEVTIVYHGGEPLLMKKERFTRICETLHSRIAPIAKLRFSIQTNAMLLDDEWIEIFERFGISVGVSVDGPANFHDARRLDHNGNGTYARTIQGVRLLTQAEQLGRIPGLGALAVVSPEYNGREVYKHLVHELGFKNINFLLPMDTHDQFDTSLSSSYSNYICDAFDQWVEDDNPKVHVRLFDQILRFFTSQENDLSLRNRGTSLNEGVHISTNGDLGDDELKPTNFAQMVGNVRSMSLVEYLNSPELLYLHAIKSSVPTACEECSWRGHCLGGAKNGIYSARYSLQNGFDNPSTICPSLKRIYSHLAGYILSVGLDIERLERRLSHRDEDQVPVAALPSITTIKRRIIAIAANNHTHAYGN